MRKLLMWNLLTLDGLLEGACRPSAKGEPAELMNGMQKVVSPRTLERLDWANASLAKGDADGKRLIRRVSPRDNPGRLGRG